MKNEKYIDLILSASDVKIVKLYQKLNDSLKTKFKTDSIDIMRSLLIVNESLKG